MRIITVICWGVAALALAGIAIWFLTGTVFGFGTGRFFTGLSAGVGWENLTGPYQIDGTYTVPADNIDSMNINWISGGITVTPYDGGEIKITEYAQRALNDGEKLRLSTSGSTITVEFSEDRTLLRMPSKKLEVLIPQALSGKIQKLNIDSTSGSVTVETISTSEFKVSSISGSLHLTDIGANTISVNSTSGSVTISDVSAEDMDIRSVSGSIRLSDTVLNLIKCNTTSGSVNLSGSFREADLGSISGSVTIKSAVVPGSLRVNTTSGSVSVTVPNEGAVSVSHSSTSGRLSSDIPVMMQNKDAQFRFSSVSGSVRIYALD